MLDILKTIAGGIMAVLATVFGAHQTAVAISPPHPTSIQVTAAPSAANSTAISSTSSAPTTQQFQDLSSVQHPASQQNQSSQQHSNQTAQQPAISSQKNQTSAQQASAIVPLLATVRAVVINTPTFPPGSSCPVFNRNLFFGSSGADVSALQKALGISPSGFFGRQTKAAVKAWQSQNGINPTGFFGPMSRANWNCNSAPDGTGIFSATPNAGVAPLTVIFDSSVGTSSTSIDFGDGNTGSLGNHTYAAPGTYTARLMRTSSGPMCPTVSYDPNNPLSLLNLNVTNGCAGQTTTNVIGKVTITVSGTSFTNGLSFYVNGSAAGPAPSGGGGPPPPSPSPTHTPTPAPTPSPASCTFNGQTIASGQSVTAHQSATTPHGSTCGNETRTCSNGTLSGSKQYASCSVESAPSVPTIAACSTANSNTCATVTNASGNHEVWLLDKTLYLIDSQLMGKFSINGVSHDLAYIDAAYADSVHASNSVGRSVSIIDLTDAKLIAWADSPEGYGQYDTYFDYITDPSGKKYPFIAPGQRYLNKDHWNFLCIFDPAYIASPSSSCFTGFKPYTVSFTTPSGVSDLNASGFRHDGGWVQDVDGDGWGDINLPYLQYIVTISGKTGQQIGLSHFDVAAQSEPNSPPYFHSGRLYGGFTVFTDPNTGTQKTLIAAANAVGTFSDLYCNVSRYFAVMQWAGSGYDLQWSDYLSFSKTVFNYPYDSVTNYSRLGNDLAGCAHRYGDSLEWINGKPVIIYDYFKKTDPAPVCQAKLLEEQKSGFTNDAPYENQCAPSKIPQATGTWSVRFLNVSNGGGVNANSNSYVWGDATNMIPGNPDLLLIQKFTSNSGVVTFDQTASSIDSFQLVQLNSIPGWNVIATISSPPAPPKIIDPDNYYGAYPAGIGASWEGIPELHLKDIDGDGLNDVELTNGQWLGWSAAQGKLIIKNAPSS